MFSVCGAESPKFDKRLWIQITFPVANLIGLKGLGAFRNTVLRLNSNKGVAQVWSKVLGPAIYVLYIYNSTYT